VSAHTTDLSHVQCRTFGHAWYETDADKRSQIGWYLWLRCERCETVRMDTVDRHGNLSARSYRHPTGYKWSEKVTRSELRVILHRRKLRAVS
jgi:hypothetical protein